jgi:molecular chaperone DnaK
MVQDAEANAEADKKFEEVVAARNTADGMVHAARKTLEEAGEHATDDERAAIEAAITEVEEAIKDDDAAAMEAATTKLTEATGGVAQKMYAAQQAEGAAAEGAEAQPDETEQGDVVDAEFEEVQDDKRA